MKLLVAILLLFGTVATITDVKAETNTVSSNTVSSNTVDKAPPSAISPGISRVNSDVCVSAYSGSGTTQILGVSTGVTVSDENCVRIKLSRQMMSLNLKVPAVAILAQDPQAFDALWMSGVYPPIGGKIAEESKEIWLANVDMMPEGSKIKNNLLQNREKEKEPEGDFDGLKNFGLMALSLLLLF